MTKLSVKFMEALATVEEIRGREMAKHYVYSENEDELYNFLKGQGYEYNAEAKKWELIKTTDR